MYVLPHKKISRPVTEADMVRVLQEAEIMQELCEKKHGVHRGAYAIAHPQINDSDPLRFFVFRTDLSPRNTIICNPAIVHSSFLEELKTEGCMSFPDEQPTAVARAHKVDVTYQVFANGELVHKFATYANLKAQIFQHEIDHLNGKYIFPL